MGIRAIVRNGRLVLDEPTELPEGTVLHLVVDDIVELTPQEQKELEAAIAESRAQLENGEYIHADELLADLGRAHR
jgi:hypothetical protein